MKRLLITAILALALTACHETVQEPQPHVEMESAFTFIGRVDSVNVRAFTTPAGNECVMLSYRHNPDIQLHCVPLTTTNR